MLAALAAAVPLRPGGVSTVAIDGVDGAGKTRFAAGLLAALRAAARPAVVVHLDDFHRLRADRYRRGRDDPDGFWLDSYDYDALRQRVLDPVRAGAPVGIVPASSDLARDVPVTPPPVRLPAGSVLVIEGLFLHRDELAGEWDLSVLLDVPFAETARRMHLRDGTPPDPDAPALRRYVEGQRRYFAACDPRSRASVMLDNTDPAQPVVLQARVPLAEGIGRDRA